MMRTTSHLTGSLLVAVTLLACSGADDSEAATAATTTASKASTSKNSMALINGKVYTVNNKQAWAEAVIIKDGKITFVGSTAEAKTRLAGVAEVIDLKGKMVMPGVEDSHMHPLEAGSEAVSCLLTADEAISAQLDTIADCADHDTTGSD